jgi:hypothetical protein
MAYVLDDDYSQLPPPPTRAEVEADLLDWKRRLKDLIEDICIWARDFPNVECEIGTVSKIERKMRMVGLTQPVDLPAVLIHRLMSQSVTPVTEAERTVYMKQLGLPGRIHRNEACMSITPDARWVIGTRGQLLVRSYNRYDTIADIGLPGQPDWRLIRHADPEDLTPFTKETLHELLEQLR